MNQPLPDYLKPCDIRGLYPKPLGLPQAEQIGQAVGTLIKESPDRNIKVVVGHDVRHSGEVLKKALILGLKNTGLKILDAGRVSTPLLAFSTRFAKAAAGVMVTASHNPPDHNGFKFFTGGVPASIDWISALYGILEKKQFRKGAGVVEKKDFYADYRNALVNELAHNFQGVRICVDLGNGASALTAPMVLEALNCDSDFLNAKPDGGFPGRGADSSTPAALGPLGERVVRKKAQLGVSFDGDGDRVSFVDEKGREVPNDVMLCLFAGDLARRAKGQKVVYDGKCSDLAAKRIAEEGGIPLLERSGHSYIFARMVREKAALGGEASGHFFLPGDFPGDALFACLRVLEILKTGRKTLGSYLDEFPPRVATHDLILELSPDAIPALYGNLQKRALEMGGQVTTLDGVRAVFEEGWGIVRKSVTQPHLTCRFEAPNQKKMASFVGEWFRDDPEVRKKVLEKI